MSSDTDTEVPICSAKGCRRQATWAIQWNNPKIHPPERRKTWLACDEHRSYLTDFLNRRSFVREVEALDDSGTGNAGAGDAGTSDGS